MAAAASRMLLTVRRGSTLLLTQGQGSRSVPGVGCPGSRTLLLGSAQKERIPLGITPPQAPQEHLPSCIAPAPISWHAGGVAAFALALVGQGWGDLGVCFGGSLARPS